MQADPTIQDQATTMLIALSAGELDDPEAFSSLLYHEMRSMAGRMMAGERRDHTLQPTALVHEAYLRLIHSDATDAHSQDRFYLLAARVMRNILIDHARSAKRLKRGGGRARVPITAVDPESKRTIEPGQLLDIDAALMQLRLLDERKAKVVELRFFGGLDEEATARILGIARSTASSDWRFARAWLHNKLGDSQGASAP